MISVRAAVEDDIDALYTLDDIAQREEGRREFIRSEVAAGDCFVVVIDETVVGYGVLNYTFYNNGCIDMVYIDSDHRRRGVGTALIRHMESQCRTAKLFTSTNESNLEMSLLAKLGYNASGVIHNLEEGDPNDSIYRQVLMSCSYCHHIRSRRYSAGTEEGSARAIGEFIPSAC